MKKEDVKALVMRYFSLVPAGQEAKEEVKVTFAEVKTADGDVTLYYEGDLGVGTKLSIMDAEGNMMPAPEGDHFIVYDEKQWRIVLDAEGTILELDEMTAESEAMVEEILPGKHEGPATMISFQEMEEIVEAVVEAVKEEMMKKFGEYEEKIEAMSKTVSTFSKAPASTKTLPKTNQEKFQKPEYKPVDANRLEAAMERFAKRKK